MKILILGGGQVGKTVAYNLVKSSNYEITIIDQDEHSLQLLSDQLDIQAIAGNATSPSVLKAAGVEDTELLIAVTGNDEINLVACNMAKKLFNVPNTIARIRQSELIEFARATGNKNDDRLTPLDLFGVDNSICPEQIVTEQLFQLLLTPGALQVINFEEINDEETLHVQMIVTRVQFSSQLVGKQFSDLTEILPEKLNFKICAVYRNEALIIPTTKTRIITGDELYFIAPKDQVPEIMRFIRPDEKVNKKIMIAGGGNIGYRLAKTAEPYFQTKMIDHNLGRSEYLAEHLNSSLIFHGSATDENILLDEHVEEIDMFFALTNNDEDNIMSSLMAKKLGAKRVASIINRAIYVDILVGHTIDILISPHLSTIGSILSHLRKGDIVAVYPLRRGDAEMLEVIIHGDKKTSKIIGRKSEQINWPHGIDVAAIVSDGKFITHSKHELKEGDHLIFFVYRSQSIPELEKLLQVKWKFF